MQELLDGDMSSNTWLHMCTPVQTPCTRPFSIACLDIWPETQWENVWPWRQHVIGLPMRPLTWQACFDFSQVSISKTYCTQDLHYRKRHHKRTRRKRQGCTACCAGFSCTHMASASGRREHIWHHPDLSLEHSLLMEDVKVLPVKLSTVV